ncbi:NADH dehydrogenase [Rhodococcus wratislaviensis]|uniref:NADH:ubiquinone reductase (non-electrogenic) n=1 Tax=Rhodococcus wratislaviensis TaxID=44752 RepID=A0A402C2P6_RHOWR|nr:NAD(P)/FAD-dependent oxidoreductase [Rhodococcus wratislaviensis]GCE37913.1 NADH dehydrogenase [Rhodococcus wratislaviensis]
MSTQQSQPRRHRVVVIGSGFGGLFATKTLRRADVDVTVIDRTTHHLFQPLLYQVATGILSEGEIAASTRMILKGQRNAAVRAGNVTSIDLSAQTVTSVHLGRTTVTEYDSLIVSAGAQQSYFGNDHFAEHAPGMKTIDDALELRGRILGAFEQAEVCEDPDEWGRLLTFVVVGAGPTGVEMAGQIAELAHRTLVGAFTNIDPRNARIVLLDAASAVLPPFGDNLGSRAAETLERLGVEVLLGASVTDVDATGLTYRDSEGARHRIESVCKVWSAGVAASPLGRQLAEQCGASADRAGRIAVEGDLTLPGHPNVFVVGDMMSLDRLPGVAQVAMQGGRYAARQIAADVAAAAKNRPTPERTQFEYRDMGSMATISRFNAVASVGGMEVSGFIAWVMWLAVHVVYIVGFRSRIATLLSWTWTFLGSWRGQMTVTEQQTIARNALGELHQLRVLDEADDSDGVVARVS